MRHNFTLVTTATILSMLLCSHTAISSPHIASSEVVKPYCHASCIDAIPFQSCSPSELTRDARYCKATAIPKSTKNIYCAGGASTESSRVVMPASTKLLILAGILIATFVLLVFYRKYATYEYQLLQEIERGPEKKPSAKQLALSCIEKSESNRSASQSNPAHKIPPICDLLIEAFDELDRHPEIYEDPKFYNFATIFLMAKPYRRSFMEVPADQRVAWLKERRKLYNC